jgi:hypothetical protein
MKMLSLLFVKFSVVRFPIQFWTIAGRAAMTSGKRCWVLLHSSYGPLGYNFCTVSRRCMHFQSPFRWPCPGIAAARIHPLRCVPFTHFVGCCLLLIGRILAFFVGFFPVYLAFVFLAIAMFGQQVIFSVCCCLLLLLFGLLSL